MQSKNISKNDLAAIMSPPNWANPPEDARAVGTRLSDEEFDVIRDLRLRLFPHEERFSAVMRKLLLTGVALHLHVEAMAAQATPKKPRVKRTAAASKEVK